MSRSGGSEGLAFASTSNTARHLLLDQKPFWTGIEGILIDGSTAKALNLPQPPGVLVQRVAEGSIAWRWGIHGGTLRSIVEGEERGSGETCASSAKAAFPDATCISLQSPERSQCPASATLHESLVLPIADWLCSAAGLALAFRG